MRVSELLSALFGGVALYAVTREMWLPALICAGMSALWLMDLER